MFGILWSWDSSKATWCSLTSVWSSCPLGQEVLPSPQPQLSQPKAFLLPVSFPYCFPALTTALWPRPPMPRYLLPHGAIVIFVSLFPTETLLVSGKEDHSNSLFPIIVWVLSFLIDLLSGFSIPFWKWGIDICSYHCITIFSLLFDWS